MDTQLATSNNGCLVRNSTALIGFSFYTGQNEGILARNGMPSQLCVYPGLEIDT
jgi:hypothetical protein